MSQATKFCDEMERLVDALLAGERYSYSSMMSATVDRPEALKALTRVVRAAEKLAALVDPGLACPEVAAAHADTVAFLAALPNLTDAGGDE